MTAETGIPQCQSYQAAWADFDDDGDMDLLAGGRLFRNPGNGNHWMKVKLVGGGKVNQTAIGTQVRIVLEGKTLTRQVEGAVGEGNQNELTLHFGLGGHDGPVTRRVFWPNGREQEVKAEVDRVVVVEYARGE